MNRWFVILVRFAILLLILIGWFPSIVSGHRVPVLICAGCAIVIFVLISERSRKLKENKFNQELRHELEIEKRKQTEDFSEREKT